MKRRVRAFEHIYRENFPFVWTAAHRCGVPSEAVEDVVQDVFITAHRRLHELDWEVSARGWLFGVTRDVAMRHRRGSARRSRREGMVAQESARAVHPHRRHDAVRTLETLLRTGVFTTEVPSRDTEASTGSDTEGSGDTGDSPACSGVAEDNFSWQWSFGSYEPEIDEEDLSYGADATVPLECDVLSFEEDAQGDELSLILGCEAGGSPIENQQLSLSPIPGQLSLELSGGNAFTVSFRPELECPNGCFIEDNGWLSIRRVSDAQVMVHIVDVHDVLPPDELAPISVTTADSGCARIFDTDGSCPTPGWEKELDVVVELPNDSVTITGSGIEGGVKHWSFVNQAIAGLYDRCFADGGSRGQIQVMVTHAFAIK